MMAAFGRRQADWKHVLLIDVASPMLDHAGVPVLVIVIPAVVLVEVTLAVVLVVVTPVGFNKVQCMSDKKKT